MSVVVVVAEKVPVRRRYVLYVLYSGSRVRVLT